MRTWGTLRVRDLNGAAMRPGECACTDLHFLVAAISALGSYFWVGVTVTG